MKKIFNLLSYLLIILSIVLLMWRNNLILGTFFIMFRWSIIVFLLLFLIIAFKKKLLLKKYLFFASVLIILESTYVFIRTTHLNFNFKTTQTNTLKVIDYNIYFKNKDKNASLNLIKNKNADLVLLQEVTPEWNTKLNNNLNYKFSLKNVRKGTHGISMYSKYPIKLVKYINNDFGLPIAQIAALTFGNNKILIVNAHLASPAKAVENPDKFLNYYFENYHLRKQEFKTIEKYIENVEANYEEILLVGDLNTTEYEPLYRDLKYTWKNANSDVLLKNFPNSHKMIPIINLDYIFYRNNLKVQKFEVLKGGSSDHSAIYTELLL